MRIVSAVLRILRRSWPAMAAIGTVFAVITAGRCVIAFAAAAVGGGGQPAWDILIQLPLAFVMGGLVGCLIGLLGGILAKSVNKTSDSWSFQANPLGVVGAVLGFLAGGYVGFLDHDGVIRCFGQNLDAIAVGLMMGLFTVGFLGATLGEIISPSTQKEEALNKAAFKAAYADKAPWNIPNPQPSLVGIADQITGSVLDVGCGTGENALFFAQRGHHILGIDFLEEPIQRANEKANQRGLSASFMVMDALSLNEMQPDIFDSAIDCGLFHVFSDQDRKRYVDGLATVLKPDGQLFLLCFSDEEPGTNGPRRISKAEIQTAFAIGWTIDSIVPSRFQTIPEFRETFSEGGPKAWLVVARRLQ